MLSKSATKDNIESYQWYVYDGKNFEVRHRNTRRVLQKGDEFAIRYGVRSQSSRAFLIFKDNVKNDYGITEKDAQKLIKKSEEKDKPRNLLDLLEESKSKRVRTQGMPSRYVAADAWDAPRYRKGGRLPSPKNHGYASKDFQWRSVTIPLLTVYKTRSVKHTFQKGEWVGLRFDSDSRGGYIVDIRGIIFKISAEVYDDIVDSTEIVEKNRWPDFDYSAEQVEQLAEERVRDEKASRKRQREQATKQRAERIALQTQERLRKKRERLQEEEDLKRKGKEAKIQDRLKKSRKHLGLDRTPDQAFDEFLRGNILDDVEDNIDFDLGDENVDIGSNLPDDEKDFDVDEDNNVDQDVSDEDDGEEPEEDFEQEDPEEDLMSRDDENDQDLLDDLDDEINKERDALEDSLGDDDEELDMEDDEDLEDEEADGGEEEDEDDFDPEDDDFDPEDDEPEEGADEGNEESEEEEEDEGESTDEDDGDDDFDPEDDGEEDSTDEDAEEDEGDSADDTDEGDEESEEPEDSDPEDGGEDEDGDGDESAGEEESVDEDEDDTKGDVDSEEKEEKKVAVGDVVTFKADEVKQRQFLVFEIVPGKKNPNVTNYLLFNLKGDGKTYNIFRSSNKAKTKIEQATDVLRRASGSELRKVFKMADNLSLDRSPIIS